MGIGSSYQGVAVNGNVLSENDTKYQNLLDRFKSGGGDPNTYVTITVGNETWHVSYTQGGQITGDGLERLRDYLRENNRIDEIKLSRMPIDSMVVEKQEGAIFYPSLKVGDIIMNHFREFVIKRSYLNKLVLEFELPPREHLMFNVPNSTKNGQEFYADAVAQSIVAVPNFLNMQIRSVVRGNSTMHEDANESYKATMYANIMFKITTMNSKHLIQI